MKSHSTGRVPFGLRDGGLHFVTQVETGLACGCVCPDPNCGKPLVARNQQRPDRRRAYYFAHAGTSAGCGGRESALHRMAKDIVQSASALLLPAWSALDGDLSFDACEATIAPGSAQEVNVVEAQMRPDVRVGAIRSRCYLQSLYVEIKVSHAVDHAKRARVIDHGLSMIEIDLSDVSDEIIQDEAAFTNLVIQGPGNRHWIHIGNPAFLANQLGTTIYCIASTHVRDKSVPTRKGNTLILKEQAMLRYEPEGEEPSTFLGELADTVRIDGQRVDCYGNQLPYAPGLYVRGHPKSYGPYDSSRYKTQLRPITMDAHLTTQSMLI